MTRRGSSSLICICWLKIDPSPHRLGPGLVPTFAVSLTLSPPSPAVCKLHTCKYNFSLLKTVIGGCYIPTIRNQLWTGTQGLKREFLSSENGRHNIWNISSWGRQNSYCRFLECIDFIHKHIPLSTKVCVGVSFNWVNYTVTYFLLQACLMYSLICSRWGDNSLLTSRFLLHFLKSWRLDVDS